MADPTDPIDHTGPTAPRGETMPDEAVQLRWQLVTQLNNVQRDLQKWHAGARRVSGSIASDVYRGQGRVLATLSRCGELSQSELCVQLGVRPQSLGELIVKLERGGYVARRPSPSDRRSQLVSITETGRACIERGQSAASFDCFTDDEIRQFIGYLERAAQCIEADCTAMAAMPPYRPADGEDSGTVRRFRAADGDGSPQRCAQNDPARGSDPDGAREVRP